ncbi:MAG: GntR family transcriptional regulator [Betaproteobacteria bacterium]
MNDSPRAPRYRSIAEELAAEIREGQYPLGAQLPVEHDLAARFDASRQTVREALRLLAGNGLIVRRAGSGTTVINTDARALFTLSLGNLGQLLSYPESVVRRHLIAGHVVADATAARTLGCEPGTAWYRIRALRSSAADGKPICWVDIHIRPEYAAVAKSRLAERVPVVEQIERRFGEAVESAEVDISLSRVPAEMAGALEVEPGSPALTIVRRYIGKSGQPFEITVSIHPENRYTYRMKLRKGKG